MDIRKLQRVIVDGLEDVKAQNIVVFNTEHLSPLFERVIVASGTSNRQTRSLAASVRDAVKSAGEPAPRTEGEDNGEWIIVDCGAAVVHVMQPAIREYYHLEELWGDKPVRMKIGAVPPARLVKAQPAPAEERRTPPREDRRSAAREERRAPPRRANAAEAPVPKGPARRAASAAPGRGGSIAPRPPARKSAPSRHVVRTVGVKSAAKNAAASARPAPSRRAPAKKTSAKR
jgi:ribosome-associated protein